jgi:hypothetical protein
MGEDWDIEENPSTEKKQYALSAVGKGLIGGFILGVVLTYATMIWPTNISLRDKDPMRFQLQRALCKRGLWEGCQRKAASEKHHNDGDK